MIFRRAAQIELFLLMDEVIQKASALLSPDEVVAACSGLAESLISHLLETVDDASKISFWSYL